MISTNKYQKDLIKKNLNKTLLIYYYYKLL